MDLREDARRGVLAQWMARFRPEADIHVVQMAWPSQQPVLYFLFLSPP